MNQLTPQQTAPPPLLPTCHRVTITEITPQIDAGIHAIKRTLGEAVIVEADIFADGHASLSAVIKYRPAGITGWLETPMRFLSNDRWRGDFTVNLLGYHAYTIEAWVDHFQTWRKKLEAKLAVGQDVSMEIQIGAELIEAAAKRAPAEDAQRLLAWAAELQLAENAAGRPLISRVMEESLAQLMARYADRRSSTVHEPPLSVIVDPVRAQFSAWYEMFPRSFAPEAGKHGTFKDCAAHLPRIAALGFDVLYFPPIHPIGKSFRKGRNNNPRCGPDEPGSPWAIGSSEGGHKSIHPELGTLEDFQELIRSAGKYGLELALDIAFQCSPDHPYVREHPEWFRHRPDGSIQYAENPPKKYEDIYPFDFECEDWRGLWQELKSVFDFWIQQGIKIFRVDNPHTKTFAFWEWCIRELKMDHPELIFLAEAFTRPKLMYELAKLGFSQSYNYFPWRNSKAELESYFVELTQSPVADFFRPNLWPNTPDILTHFLQTPDHPAFAIRFVLAATLGASYGIYGPAFEHYESTPREAGAEDYLDSEKYEIKHWDLSTPTPLERLITRVNQIRRENRALQSNRNLRFQRTDNDQLIAYTKAADDGGAVILTVVNLSPQHTHSGWLDLPLTDFNLDSGGAFPVDDLLNDARYEWRGPHNYISLNPANSPAHIFRLRRPAGGEEGATSTSKL